MGVTAQLVPHHAGCSVLTIATAGEARTERCLASEIDVSAATRHVEAEALQEEPANGHTLWRDSVREHAVLFRALAMEKWLADGNLLGVVAVGALTTSSKAMAVPGEVAAHDFTASVDLDEPFAPALEID